MSGCCIAHLRISAACCTASLCCDDLPRHENLDLRVSLYTLLLERNFSNVIIDLLSRWTWTSERIKFKTAVSTFRALCAQVRSSTPVPSSCLRCWRLVVSEATSRSFHTLVSRYGWQPCGSRLWSQLSADVIWLLVASGAFRRSMKNISFSSFVSWRRC